MFTTGVCCQQEDTHISGSLINGDIEIEKNDKDHRKKTQSKQCRGEVINATSSRDIRTFLEKCGTISSKKKGTPKKVEELGDEE